MRWIVLGMILFVVPYTYINLHFRKPGRPYLPYDDTRERAHLGRAGYARVTASLSRPADQKLEWDAGREVAGGLPETLRASLIDQPLLPAAIGRISAAPDTDHLSSYKIEFASTQADNTEQPAEAKLYVKDGDIFVVPGYERLTGGLLARTRENILVVTVPPGSLSAGTYRVTLIGQRVSKSWTLQVH